LIYVFLLQVQFFLFAYVLKQMDNQTTQQVAKTKALQQQITEEFVAIVNDPTKDHESLAALMKRASEVLEQNSKKVQQKNVWNYSTKVKGGADLKEVIIDCLQEPDIHVRVTKFAEHIDTTFPKSRYFSLLGYCTNALFWTCVSVGAAIPLIKFAAPLSMLLAGPFTSAIGAYVMLGYYIYQRMRHAKAGPEQKRILESLCNKTGKIAHAIDSLSKQDSKYTYLTSPVYAIMLRIIYNLEPDLTSAHSERTLHEFLTLLIYIAKSRPSHITTSSDMEIFFKRLVYFENNESYRNLISLVRKKRQLTSRSLLHLYLKCSAYQNVLSKLSFTEVDSITRNTESYPYSINSLTNKGLETTTKTLEKISGFIPSEPSSEPTGILYWKSRGYATLSDKISFNLREQRQTTPPDRQVSHNGIVFQGLGHNGGAKPKKKTVNKPVKENPYRIFMREHLLKGKKMAEVAAMWRKTKA
jgi:hypothetical protein